MGILVLMFELSRSYLTRGIVELGFGGVNREVPGTVWSGCQRMSSSMGEYRRLMCGTSYLCGRVQPSHTFPFRICSREIAVGGPMRCGLARRYRCPSIRMDL